LRFTAASPGHNRRRRWRQISSNFRRGNGGSIFNVDGNFIGNKRKVKELLTVMAEWNMRHGRPFSFYTETSVNLADDAELLQMMETANFDFEALTRLTLARMANLHEKRIGELGGFQGGGGVTAAVNGTDPIRAMSLRAWKQGVI
jgi:hypothetical protein